MQEQPPSGSREEAWQLKVGEEEEEAAAEYFGREKLDLIIP
jgi:hypothetical protein